MEEHHQSPRINLTQYPWAYKECLRKIDIKPVREVVEYLHGSEGFDVYLVGSSIKGEQFKYNDVDLMAFGSAEKIEDSDLIKLIESNSGKKIQIGNGNFVVSRKMKGTEYGGLEFLKGRYLLEPRLPGHVIKLLTGRETSSEIDLSFTEHLRKSLY